MPMRDSETGVRWTQVDPYRDERLVEAIYADSRIDAKRTLRNNISSAVVLLFISVVWYMFVKDIGPILFSMALVILAWLIFGPIIVIQSVQAVAGLHPEKQAGVWIFRARCTGVQIHHRNDPDTEESYSALFAEAGKRVKLHIPRHLYNGYDDVVGKEYIFYSFSEKKQKPRHAIAAERLEEREAAFQL